MVSSAFLGQLGLVVTLPLDCGLVERQSPETAKVYGCFGGLVHEVQDLGRRSGALGAA